MGRGIEFSLRGIRNLLVRFVDERFLKNSKTMEEGR